MKRLTHIAGLALLLGAAPIAAAAQPVAQEKTVLAFDAPVEVPDMTLEAGSYMFKLARQIGTQQVVQIWSGDETKLFTTTITVPIRRLDTTGDVVVKFASTPQGQPPAIKSWFYPGALTGHQFVYPDEQARRIARTSKELVLSGDIDPSRPESAGAEPFALVDEQGRQQPFETHRPPAVTAARGEAEEGSGQVRVHGMEGDEAVQHHLNHIVRLADVTLSGRSEQQPSSEGAVGTAGSTEAETVSVPRAHLEQIREHARKAQEELNDQ